MEDLIKFDYENHTVVLQGKPESPEDLGVYIEGLERFESSYQLFYGDILNLLVDIFGEIGTQWFPEKSKKTKQKWMRISKKVGPEDRVKAASYSVLEEIVPDKAWPHRDKLFECETVAEVRAKKRELGLISPRKARKPRCKICNAFLVCLMCEGEENGKNS